MMRETTTTDYEKVNRKKVGLSRKELNVIVILKQIITAGWEKYA